MTRLFGCISNQPQRLGEALASVRAALVAGGPLARWGVGYVQSGEVLLSLHPREVKDELDFYPVVSGVASDYVLGAADVEDGLRGQVNTQPFRFRRWLFAQENRAPEPASDGGEAAIAALTSHIPDFLRRNVRGRSVQELFFHVFLAMLHDAGTLDEPDLDPKNIRRALRDTAAFIASVAGRTGATLPVDNLVVTNSRSLVAARLAGPMFVRRLKQQTDPRRPESQFRSVLVVSAAAAPGEGFEELPARSAVTVARDVSVDLADLDS
jgi:hypothetical protein